MRITVNLSYFFHDHRSMAKIFINERMRIIKDVEDHLSRIFNINGFYFKCENQYLPSTEDIRVVNNDDVIWVVPLDENQIEPSKQVMVESKINLQEATSQKVSFTESAALAINTYAATNEHPCKMKKNKKLKKSASKELNTNLDTKQNTPESCTANTIKTKSPSKETCGDELVNSNKNKTIKKKADKLNSNKKESLKSDINSKCNNFKQNMLREFFENNQKKINIVKTIIVSSSCKTSQSTDATSTEMVDQQEKQMPLLSAENSQNNENTEKTIIVSSSCKTSQSTEATSTEMVDQQEKQMPLLSAENSQNNEITEKQSASSDDFGDAGKIFNAVKKRKRKRTHKKKDLNISIENNEFVSQELKFNCVVKTAPTQIGNAVHVRFEEAENKLDNDADTIVDVGTKSDVSTKDGKSFEISDEFITKHPVTPNIQPKLGDIFAFKILRISDIYTPEVSSNIVGKVISYHEDSGEIIFDLLYGTDQCIQPQGKFSLDLDETPDTSNNYLCTWFSLLEPRLLYP